MSLRRLIKIPFWRQIFYCASKVYSTILQRLTEQSTKKWHSKIQLYIRGSFGIVICPKLYSNFENENGDRFNCHLHFVKSADDSREYMHEFPKDSCQACQESLVKWLKLMHNDQIRSKYISDSCPIVKKK